MLIFTVVDVVWNSLICYCLVDISLIIFFSSPAPVQLK